MSDLIKRSDAIEAVWKPQVKPNELIFDALKTAIESEINNVPSADRPQGEWIDGKCSLCGKHAPYWAMATTYYKSNYCPSCGARMKGADDE